MSVRSLLMGADGVRDVFTTGVLRSERLAWYGVTCSADGTKIAATTGNNTYGSNYIYTSPDAGATWVTRSSMGSRDFRLICSSSDGFRLAATVYTTTFKTTPGVFISNDAGNTWSGILGPAGFATTGLGAIDRIYCSPDGNTLIVSGVNCRACISFNRGASWQFLSTTATIRNVCAVWAKDGSNKVAYTGSVTKQLLMSTDGGRTFTAKGTYTSKSESYPTLAGSADLKTLITSVGTAVYISRDYGSSWSTVSGLPSSANRNNFTMSADGKKILAVSGFWSDTDPLYASSDGGYNWSEIKELGARNWNSGACSDDGTKFYAAARGTEGYTTSQPSPTRCITAVSF